MPLVLHIFKAFFILLCEFTYTVVSYMYQILILISESNIFSNEVIQDFSSRIYVLLGVFMLFKVSFSLVNYIVNPDDFTDKQKGVNKLVPNIMITLVIIVFTPRIFAELMDLQHLITSQHLIDQVVLGPNYVESEGTTLSGDTLALNVYGSFIYYAEGPNKLDPDEAGLLSLHMIEDSTSKTWRYSSTFGAFSSGSTYNTYNGIWDDKIQGSPLFALIGGVLLLLTLIQFSFDIAIRTVKFGFLQLIAPIPIISRVDPKSAKNGMFSKWLKLCVKTYLDLFMRLAILYFAIAIIEIIVSSDLFTINATGQSNVIVFAVKAFLVIGTLMFAKQLPKMLEDLFGIKLDGGFTLNPMKRLASTPLIGGAANAGIELAGASALAAGRLATGTVKGVAKGLVSDDFKTGFRSGIATDLNKAGYRLQAGWGAAKGNFANWSGNGKYSTMKDSYSKLTENYKKGKEAFKKIDKQWVEGAELKQKLANKGYTFDNFDGKNRDAYNTVYKHEEFVDSLMNLDKQDAINKEYTNAIYEAQTLGSDWEGTVINGKAYTRENVAQLKADAEKSQKAFNGLEKVHDTMRMTYEDDAKAQDAIKMNKYNPINPTAKDHPILRKMGRIEGTSGRPSVEASRNAGKVDMDLNNGMDHIVPEPPRSSRTSNIGAPLDGNYQPGQYSSDPRLNNSFQRTDANSTPSGTTDRFSDVNDNRTGEELYDDEFRKRFKIDK